MNWEIFAVGPIDYPCALQPPVIKTAPVLKSIVTLVLKGERTQGKEVDIKVCHAFQAPGI
jgi:hypothetical protein